MFDLDLVSKARVILGVKQLTSRGIRRPTDLLITSITPGIILLLSFLITANKMLQKPVGCMNMPMTSRWYEYVESQCWVKGPYYIDINQHTTDELDESRRLSYYAYLPYIFGFSAAIPYIPYFIFSLLMRPFALKLEAIYSGCEILAAVNESGQSSISGNNNNNNNNNLAQNEQQPFKTLDRIYFHITGFKNDRYYISLFLAARIAYTVALLLIPIFYCLAFKMNFFIIGFKAAFFFFGNFSADVGVKFPINGLCHVSIREQVQGDQRNFYNLQCNLSTNLLVSKIIGFLFILIFIIVLPLSICDTVYTFNYFICRNTKDYSTQSLIFFMLSDNITENIYKSVHNSFNRRIIAESNARDVAIQEKLQQQQQQQQQYEKKQ